MGWASSVVRMDEWDTHICSPESTDGKIDWREKIVLSIYCVIAIAVLLAVTGCTNCDFNCEGAGFVCCGPYAWTP